jgi:hypothetical protein
MLELLGRVYELRYHTHQEYTGIAKKLGFAI